MKGLPHTASHKYQARAYTLPLPTVAAVTNYTTYVKCLPNGVVPPTTTPGVEATWKYMAGAVVAGTVVGCHYLGPSYPSYHGRSRNHEGSTSVSCSRRYRLAKLLLNSLLATSSTISVPSVLTHQWWVALIRKFNY